MQPGIDTPEYWIESFAPSDADLDALSEHAIDTGTPVALLDLAELIVRRRVENVLAARRAHARSDGVVYRPADRYDVGQKLVFPALEGAEGVVVGSRPGNNAAYGAYDVIRVRLGVIEREFASGLAWEHALSQTESDIEPDVLIERYGPVVAPPLAARLQRETDWAAYGDRWFVKSLLPEVNAGHLNLAEAIIMLGGEPLPAESLLKDLDLDPSAPIQTRALALEIALAADPRFRNVGALEAPLWTLAARV